MDAEIGRIKHSLLVTLNMRLLSGDGRLEIPLADEDTVGTMPPSQVPWRGMLNRQDTSPFGDRLTLG